MDILVTYDVDDTESTEGARRLRKIATACKDFGQRVQFSVFECRVNQAQFEVLRAKLKAIIDLEADSLRIYKLVGSRDHFLETYGVNHYMDFDEPLVL